MLSGSRWDAVIVGAGAAGLMAATRAARRGRRVLLLEKNTKAGVKILMSGGTRCNLTHATDRRGIADAFPTAQSRFLRSPLAALGPEELVDLFEAEGLRTKVETTGKVFPQSDRALDVQRTLLAMLHGSGATLALGEGVREIARIADGYHVQTARRELITEKVVIATGGQSYPGCGTTGDGYAWSKALGHSIVPPRPALVPLKTTEPWSHELSGLTIAEAGISIVPATGGKPLAREHGSLLLTHFGLSGPAAMDVSRVVTASPRKAGLQVEVDLLPHMPLEQLATDLQSLAGRRQVLGLVSEWLPRRLVEAIFVRNQTPVNRTAAELTRQERTRLTQALKACTFSLSGTLGFAKAEVTAGGVALGEVDSRDMQSKRCPGLYLIGEVLDIDGPIGGYNFQAAFSTGWLAGESV